MFSGFEMFSGFDQLFAGLSDPISLDEQSGPDLILTNQYAVGLTEPNQFAVCGLVVAGSVRSRELAARVEKTADLAFALISLPRPLSVNLTVPVSLPDTKGSVTGNTEHSFFANPLLAPNRSTRPW
jgi:hypothetical protein